MVTSSGSYSSFWRHIVWHILGVRSLDCVALITSTVDHSDHVKVCQCVLVHSTRQGRVLDHIRGLLAHVLQLSSCREVWWRGVGGRGDPLLGGSLASQRGAVGCREASAQSQFLHLRQQLLFLHFTSCRVNVLLCVFSGELFPSPLWLLRQLYQLGHRCFAGHCADWVLSGEKEVGEIKYCKACPWQTL